jgi:S1-C subfamily serine protease
MARGNAEAARKEAETARKELETMREQMRELSRKMAEVSTKLGDVGPRAYAYRYLGDPERGMIGVVLAGSKQGVRISAVTPGGPADKGGVRDGDIIIAVDGKAVASNDEDHDVALAPLHDLKLGQAVKLGVLRDGKKSEITVKAERREPYNFAYAFNDADKRELGQLSHLDEKIAAAMPRDFDQRVNERVDQAVRQAERVAARAGERASEQLRHALDRASFSTPWWGLNLVSLNPDLGGYFGADKGVLVLSDSNDSLKGIKSGDVLLEVAGQKVERPEDALRLLREQSTGSDVKVQVLRQRKTLSLSMKAPEFRGIFVPPPPPPVPPVPPVAPVPPVPPAPPVPPIPDDSDY